MRSAIFVNSIEKTRDRVKVFAARIGPRDVAKTDVTESTIMMTSRFHSGQFCDVIVSTVAPRSREGPTRGSFGSLLGCGTRIIGTGPEVLHLRLLAELAVATCGRSRSSKYLDVPFGWSMVALAGPSQVGAHLGHDPWI